MEKNDWILNGISYTDFQLKVSAFRYVERFFFFPSVTVAFIVGAVKLFAF